MRRIVAFERVTPEGYFTDADGDEQPLFVRDPEMDKDLMANASAATYLFGRRTYEHMVAFWPNALHDPHLPPAMREMAKTLNDDEKIVFSRTLKQPTWNNTRVLTRLEPTEIRKLKEERGPDMLVLGSGSIVSQLTQHQLVDEYILVVSPLLAGAGRPLFQDVATRTPLKLIGQKSYSSGNVVLRYERSEAFPTTGFGT